MKFLLCVFAVLHIQTTLCAEPLPSEEITKNNGEAPYLALLNFNYWDMSGTVQENQYFCGATIIREDVLVTAAHCLNLGVEYLNFPKENYTVIAGTINNDWNNFDQSVQKRNIKAFHVHDNFKYRERGNKIKELENDIAIVFLDSPFDFNKYVNKISLAEEEEYGTFNNEHVKIMGWNLRELDSYYKNLRIADAVVAQYEDCPYLSTSSDGNKYRVCLKNDPENKPFDLNIGDGGNPAVVNFGEDLENQKVIAIGSYVLISDDDLELNKITNSEYGPAYVDIAFMRPWINSWLSKYDEDPNSVLD